MHVQNLNYSLNDTDFMMPQNFDPSQLRWLNLEPEDEIVSDGLRNSIRDESQKRNHRNISLGLASGFLSGYFFLACTVSTHRGNLEVLGYIAPGLIWAIFFSAGNHVSLGKAFLLTVIAGLVAGVFCFVGLNSVLTIPLTGTGMLGLAGFGLMVLAAKVLGIISRTKSTAGSVGNISVISMAFFSAFFARSLRSYFFHSGRFNLILRFANETIQARP